MALYDVHENPVGVTVLLGRRLCIVLRFIAVRRKLPSYTNIVAVIRPNEESKVYQMPAAILKTMRSDVTHTASSKPPIGRYRPTDRR